MIKGGLDIEKHKCYPLDIDWKDSYKTFLERYPDERKWEKLYELSLKFINLEIQNYIIKGRTLRLPYNLGSLSVNKYLIGTGNREKRKNWQETIKQGKNVYYTNEHTNGYYYFVNWTRGRKNRTFENKTRCYKFKPIKGLRTKVSKSVTDDYMDYPAIKPLKYGK